MTDLVLLSLMLNGPRYGYELKKQAGVILGVPEVHNNIVYPLLRKFASRRLVRRRELPAERGPKRQSYSLTLAGRKYLRSRLTAFPEREARSDSAFLLRVGLFSMLDAAARRSILASREQALRARTARLEHILRHFSPQTFPREVIRFRLRNLHAEQAWIRRLRRVKPLRSRRRAQSIPKKRSARQ